MKFIYIILVCFFLSSCNRNNYLFENGNQKLILKVDDGNDNLHLDKKSVMNLKLYKINLDDLSLLGPITANVISKKEIELFVTPTNKNAKDGFIKIKVEFKGENKKRVIHTFIIPVEE
jgi:hypothetical protein